MCTEVSSAGSPESRDVRKVVSIILAAGESRRMGKPKALLSIGSTTFLSTIIEAHRNAGLKEIIVVTGAAREQIEKEIEPLAVLTVHNAQYQRGQLSSIHAGLALAEKFGAGAAIIHPVDHPRVSSKTIRLLAEAASTALIAIPIFENKRGHPVGFSSSLFDELFAAPDDVGARAVVRNHEKDIVEVAADDPGILNNIDTPEQYERLRANLRNIEK